MRLPTRAFWTIEEVAARCYCWPVDIIGFAAAGHINLSASIPAVSAGAERLIGIVTLPATDLGPLLWPNANADTEVRIHRVKRSPGDACWHWITEPQDGILVRRHHIFVMAVEAERFTIAHQEARPHPPIMAHTAPEGREDGYDWCGLTLFLFKRVHYHGIPTSQAEMVRECEAWFARRSPTGDAPDESSIRRHVRPIWRTLQDEGDTDLEVA